MSVNDPQGICRGLACPILVSAGDPPLELASRAQTSLAVATVEWNLQYPRNKNYNNPL
ncbi:hypothetical protein SLEP1_g9428 [Rubroshorea leprosula]|uniref:Uncharacterized protein n=1 Tax=Rubroshorea leprosula TaxID=152421 RepID=A0AAV5I9D7_9ROSI|nr:hypothetical protein SLEP1_g9428 [Rubroshorea leprosula]